MLFHRDFRGYTGGHGKVWDYFNHALAGGWDARVYLTPESLRDDSNPWLAMPERIVATWHPEQADLLFLGGLDWLALSGRTVCQRIPVVNLVQHVRHADPGSVLRGFLGNPALRICVSRAVAEAIAATGACRGPIEVIPAGLDLSMAAATDQRVPGVFIDALKAPELGQAVARRLTERGERVGLLLERIPRHAYVQRLADAEIAVLLPHPREGFYLPALEAMALACATVVPDCLGNREYLQPEVNALVPAADPAAVAAAVIRLRADPALRAGLAEAGRLTGARFSLAHERRRFHQLVQPWSGQRVDSTSPARPQSGQIGT